MGEFREGLLPSLARDLMEPFIKPSEVLLALWLSSWGWECAAARSGSLHEAARSQHCLYVRLFLGSAHIPKGLSRLYRSHRQQKLVELGRSCTACALSRQVMRLLLKVTGAVRRRPSPACRLEGRLL